MPGNYINLHKKNYLSEANSTKRQIESGDVVRFVYKGKKVHTEIPTVLVLNPDWKGNLHGLKLDHVSTQKLKFIRNVVVAGKLKETSKQLKLRLPKWDSNIKDPYKFYYEHVRKLLRRHFRTASGKGDKGDSPYRLYNVSGVSHVKKIDYDYTKIDDVTLR